MTIEEKAARYDEMMARKREVAKEWVAKNADLHRSYYLNNKDKQIARAAEKRAAAKAAKQAEAIEKAMATPPIL